MKQVKRCKGIVKVNEEHMPSHYCETHDIYTNNPDRLCKECLQKKKDGTLWCELINNF